MHCKERFLPYPKHLCLTPNKALFTEKYHVKNWGKDQRKCLGQRRQHLLNAGASIAAPMKTPSVQ